MSEQSTPTYKTSHPLRLALRMTVGAFFGFVVGAATHAVGDGLDLWIRSAPYLYAIIGSLIGLAVELYARLKDNRDRESFSWLSSFALCSRSLGRTCIEFSRQSLRVAFQTRTLPVKGVGAISSLPKKSVVAV